MHDIEHLPGIFTLGYLGETNFRTIEIDMSAWLDEIPNGVASVIHIRPGESADQAYMAATTFENGILKWPITALDLGNYDGYGTMQISLHGMDADNHQIGKSENVRTRVNASATSMSGDIPDAQQSWMDRMTELIDEQRIQKDKIDILVDGIAQFPVVTYVECESWYNMLAMWFLSNSGQVIPGVTTHDGESYGLSLTKPDGYEPRENDLLMVRITADLKTPYQLTKYYITFSKDTETYDPETGRTYITTGNESYPIDNMNLHYDSNITLFEKDRVYVFRYHSKQVNGRTQYVYDVLNYTPGLKEAAELAETALEEAQAIIDGNVVRYDRPQSLTYEQKTQFRDNIGAAELLGGKIPANQLPSYVDDVLEYASRSAFPATGESGKIYVALDANLTYRWTGSTYVEISQSLALGETAQTAFPGDRGLAVETEVENRAKVLYAECTEIVTNPAGWRRICVSVPEGYSPKSGDYLAVKFPATNEIANPPHRYALHYNFYGAVITEDVTVMNLEQDKFDTGTVVFEADSIYLFRHIDEDECQIVGHRVGQALGDTAGTAFPGERGKAVEDAVATINKNIYATVTDIQTSMGGFMINCETDEEYSLQAGDILYVKYTDNVQTINASNQYMIRLSDQNGNMYFSAVIGNIGATEYSAGITVFENGHTYSYYYNGTNLQVVGLDAVDVEAMIKVQDTQPTESVNKMWVKETPDEEIQVPTVAEMEAGLAGKINKPAVDGTAGQILRTDGNGNTTWENAATSAEINAATDAWLQQNITNPSNPPLDRSLSLENAAAPADIVGDLKSALGMPKEVYAGLIQGNNTWSDNAARNFMVVPCEPNDRVEITASTVQTFYAFLKTFSYPITPNATPDYCSGYTARIQLAANGSVSRYTPPDCHYIYVMTNSGSDCTPKAMTVSGYDVFGQAVNQMDDIIRKLTPVEWVSGYINTNVSVGEVVNISAVVAANYNHKIIRCAPGDHIYLLGLGGGNARLWAFLDASCKLLSKSDDSASTTGTILPAPANAAFCVVNASGDREARAINVDDPIFNNDRTCVAFKNIGEMQELFTPDSVYAYVASDRSDFGQGYKGNLFEYKKTATYEDIELEDGSFARLVTPAFAPLKSNYECIDKMLEIAYSYCGAKTSFPNGITYVSLSGPFRNDGNLSGIQCSQFVNAVLQGLPYESSKLAGKSSNTFLEGGCRWISASPWVSSDEGAMSANQLAHFAAAHGWLCETQYLKDCEIGDIVFFAIDTPPYRAVDWNGIVHCAIVIAKQGKEVVCIGAGSILEPNESSPLLDATRQWYPNGTSAQAVTCQVIKDSTKAYWYNNRGLFGFARFPVTYHDLSEKEQEILSHL